MRGGQTPSHIKKGLKSAVSLMVLHVSPRLSKEISSHVEHYLFFKYRQDYFHPLLLV